MIEQMDAAMLALQAAAGGRRHYDKDHPFVQRQLALCIGRLTTLTATQPARLVRLDQALLFQDAQLPSSGRLQDLLVPRLSGHGIEWIEFQKGITEADLVSLLEQLESPARQSATPGRPLLPQGTRHVRLGCIGRDNGSGSGSSRPGASSGGQDLLIVSGMNTVAGLDSRQQAAELRRAWGDIINPTGAQASSGSVESRMADLVETIRLAVAVGADACSQLVEVKNHDEYTFVHTVNVAILSTALAEAVGMGANQVFDITLAALLHDVGKQHTPLNILRKPGQLSDAERARMERHTIDGAAILLAKRGIPDFAPIVAFEHHANIDGSGYPYLGKGGRPHLASQIVHVADVFDALRTNRPYRAAMDSERARQILLDGRGKAFDAALVDLFLEGVVKLPASTPASSPASSQTQAA